MIEVVCAIIEHEGHILLAQRPEGKHLALKWEFPGGKVEAGEPAETAIVREIMEELGCEIEVVAALPRSAHTYDRGTIEMIPFICRLTKDSAEAQAHEHAAITWTAPEQLKQYDLAPADWPVVDAYQQWLRTH